MNDLYFTIKRKKDTTNSNYSVCVAYLLYTFLKNISIVLSIKRDFFKINNWTIPYKLNERGIKWTIYVLRLKKRLTRINTILARRVTLMKSCFAGWNPNEFGWNLPPTASDEIKSAIFNLPQGRFHRAAISSTKWIYSDAGGFNWKRLQFCIKIAVFFCE